VVLTSIQRSAATYEWFINEWIHLVVIHPETRTLYRFKDGQYSIYQPIQTHLKVVDDLIPIIESHADNLPVYLIAQN
jgi:hypothetical protein